MIVTKDVKVNVNIRQARAALCTAGYPYEDIRRDTDDDIFKKALSMSDCYGVTFEIKETPSNSEFEQLKTEHEALLADMKTICEDTGDGCHLCKHYPCVPKSDCCQGWEWRGRDRHGDV